MIESGDAIKIHEIVSERFGGSHAIRDIQILESAIARPFQTFDKKDIYFSPLDKAAALIESILMNHPFVDGNSRTGYVLMRLLLMGYGFDLSASEDEKFDFILSIAKGEINYDNIVVWLKGKIKLGGIML